MHFVVTATLKIVAENSVHDYQAAFLLKIDLSSDTKHESNSCGDVRTKL
jgi:hypothetical protein